MHSYPLGEGGPEISVIGQGTWAMEYDSDPVAALRLGIDLGMTHIDTAEMYGRGAVEEIVGGAIAGRRDEVFLASKVLPENAARAETVKACERSLKRLDTEYLDLYLLHAPGVHPFAETLSAFEKLRAQGKIRLYGVSNFDAGELRAAVELAGRGRIACNQVLYHLLERQVEQDVLTECGRLGVSLVGYSPLGQGEFPGSSSALKSVAEKHGVTPYQVALAFLIGRAGVFTIPKAARLAHVAQNASAADIRLSEQEIDLIDRAFPAEPQSGRLPVL